MAATWAVNMAVTDLATKSVTVTATRTDGLDVRTYSAQGRYDTAKMAEAQVLKQYTEVFWGLYQAEKTKEAAASALVSTAQTAIANALMAKEGV